MTYLELQIRVKALKEELENRHKYGTVKLSSGDGSPISVEELQSELYNLLYKMSKFE